ncbi:hypothetical protein P154DRAFT_481203 [Amniculicola lignicola CBS 123094]|uniref:F-box domain-containing protein n=1 Tax=Amniculicola lignicola CBS 123094 TaxID=1392246 RepID=A0A6A5X138_9PLEO|nr:hypothetical protein P154DRAFT_481203 [Amniculicola lignicola CBS 123094]
MRKHTGADRALDSFTRCATSSARRHVLDALVDALNSYEIRYLQNKLAKKTFACDIVGKVPLELAVIIFSFLDADSPYYLRRVCKSWDERLRSPKILKSSLDTWYGRNDPRLSGEDLLKGQDFAIRELKAQHSHSLRHGHPYSALRIPLPFDYETTVLYEDTFAFILGSGLRVVNVCNLRTGNIWKLHGDGREQFNELSLSSELVAFSDSIRTCYAVDLATGNKKSFRLFPAALRCITCNGRTIACGGMKENGAVIYVWSFDTQKGQSFDIGWNEFPFRGCTRLPGACSLALLLDARAQTVTVFTADSRSQNSPHAATESSIQWSVFKTDGTRVVDGKQAFSDITSFALLLGFRPTDNEGRFDFRVKAHISGHYFSNSLSFQFDRRSNNFGEIRYPDKSLGWVGSSVVWWKDTFYQTETLVKGKLLQQQRSVTRFLGTSCERRDTLLTQLWHPDLQSLVERGEEFPDADAQGFRSPKIFLNEIFMAVFGFGSPVAGSNNETYPLLELFSFDKDLVLPKAAIRTLAQQFSPSSEVSGD